MPLCAANYTLCKQLPATTTAITCNHNRDTSELWHLFQQQMQLAHHMWVVFQFLPCFVLPYNANCYIHATHMLYVSTLRRSIEALQSSAIKV